MTGPDPAPPGSPPAWSPTVLPDAGGGWSRAAAPPAGAPAAAQASAAGASAGSPPVAAPAPPYPAASAPATAGGSSFGSPAPVGGPAAARRPRRATLTITRIDPWSALKLSAGFSAALVVVTIVAVMALDALLTAMGVFSSVDAVLAKTSPGLHIGYPVIDVFLVALLIGLLDVVILTAIGTLAAFLYNLVGDLTGGLEVTLAERD